MIAIVNYCAGNITSVKRALEHLGYSCEITADPATLERSDRIILPGVGNFRATRALFTNGLGAALRQQILVGKPLLGICLGMQWLFESSAEAPGLHGLGEFKGTCECFPASVKSPHVGWDQMEIHRPSRLLGGLSSGACVYFSHGYCAPVIQATAAICGYGRPFSAVVERDHVFGVQFHPEKSGEAGLAVLQNFCAC